MCSCHCCYYALLGQETNANPVAQNTERIRLHRIIRFRRRGAPKHIHAFERIRGEPAIVLTYAFARNGFPLEMTFESEVG